MIYFFLKEQPLMLFLVIISVVVVTGSTAYLL